MVRGKKKITLTDLGKMLEHVVKHMADAATKNDLAHLATKDDIKEIATKEDIAGIRSELRDIKARLKEIESAIKDHAGHGKEINHALERISAIERHLDQRFQSSNHMRPEPLTPPSPREEERGEGAPDRARICRAAGACV